MSRVRPREVILPPKTAKLTPAQEREADEVRSDFRKEIDYCECCGHSPTNPWPDRPLQCSVLTVHEIARGNGQRRKAWTERWGTLVLCWFCNSVEFVKASVWPVAKQQALLKASRPLDYAIRTFALRIRPRAPNWITDEDVQPYMAEMDELARKRKHPTWSE